MLELLAQNATVLVAIGAVAALLVAGAALYRIRLDAGSMASFEAKVSRLGEENRRLRTEFSSLVDTDDNGELPRDIADRVRASFLGAQAGDKGALTASALCRSASRTLAEVQADPKLVLAENDAAEEMRRIARVLGELIADEAGVLPQLERGEFDVLFRLAARHLAYLPEATVTPVLAYADAALKLACARARITVWVPPPLTVQTANRVREVQPDPAFRDSPLVRSATDRLQIPDHGVLVLDCVAAGWRTASDQRAPRVVTLDRSW